MTNILIRDADINDLKGILEIESSFHQPWKEEDIRYELEEDKYSNTLVAELDGKIIGFVIYFITFDSSSIAQIATREEYRRNHIGDMLMEEYIKDCHAKKVSYITLEVREHNIPAISFYKKWRFAVILKKEKYYTDGENAFYMMRKVDM